MAFTLEHSAFATHDSGESEDSSMVCREGNILVFRIVNHEYLCTSPSTATSWVKLGLAEIIQNVTTETVETTEISNPEPIETPIPKKTLPPVNDIGKCRDGYALVFRFTHHDTFCTSPSTAASWVKLGLAEIIQEATETVEEQSDTTTEIEDENKEKDTTKSNVKTSVSDKKNIILPSYPDQPSINPELLTTNDYRYPPAVHKVNDRIWVAVGYDSTNSVMIEGEKGIIIIDTLSTYESAQNVMNEFRKITDKPVKTIIYTSGNLEHVGGTRAFLEEGDDDVEIISHENNLNFYTNQNILLGQITALRNQYAIGSFLPEEGPDKNNLADIPKTAYSTIAYVPPTDTFSDEFNLDISGVKMNLVHVGGESSDQIYVWLPDDKSLLIGDNIYGIFPNTHTLRGGGYNDPMNYVVALDKIILLNPQSLILSHVKPVIEKENVRDILISTRDATQYVYDQTIRGINNGNTVDELSNMIKLPGSLENHPWLTYQKGQIPWNVKQIYYGTLGWFEGDPAFLQPVNIDKRSSKIIGAFGGPENALLSVRDAIKNGEYEWAAELATYVLYVDSENTEAKLLKAHALRVLGQRTSSFDARQLILTNALELEGKITIDHNATQINSEQLAEIPIEKLLYVLPTKLKSDKTDNLNQSVRIFYTDIDKWFTLHFRHNILAITEGIDENSRYKLILDTKIHKSIMSGDLKLIDAINSQQIEFEGNIDNILYLMGLIQEDSDEIPAKFET